jgi:hypothetical protein
MFTSHKISQDIPHLEQVVVYCDYSLRNQSQIAQYPVRFLLNNAATSPEKKVSCEKVGITFV